MNLVSPETWEGDEADGTEIFPKYGIGNAQIWYKGHPILQHVRTELADSAMRPIRDVDWSHVIF